VAAAEGAAAAAWLDEKLSAAVVVSFGSSWLVLPLLLRLCFLLLRLLLHLLLLLLLLLLLMGLAGFQRCSAGADPAAAP
jgi:hypothetical protein